MTIELRCDDCSKVVMKMEEKFKRLPGSVVICKDCRISQKARKLAEDMSAYTKGKVDYADIFGDIFGKG